MCLGGRDLDLGACEKPPARRPMVANAICDSSLEVGGRLQHSFNRAQIAPNSLGDPRLPSSPLEPNRMAAKAKLAAN